MDLVELSRSKRSKRIRRNRIIFGVLLLTILFSIAFFLGVKISQKHNMAVNATKVTAENKKQENGNSIEANNNREAKIDPKSTEGDKKNIENKGNDQNKAATPEDNKQTKVANVYSSNGRKVAYLTFDDGPSKNTPIILETLSKYNIKATFFIVGKMAQAYPDLLREEKKEGHAIGNHTYSHNYNYIYSNVNNFLDDLAKGDAAIRSVLGDYDSKLIRFPGGSFGKSREVYRQAVKKQGYEFVDWNALNGDAEANNVPANKLISRLKETSAGKEHIVVLMHDAPNKQTTVEALPQIIEYLKAQGYSFEILK